MSADKSQEPSRAAARKPASTPRKACYFNREISWLAFNRRVLEQAMDPHYPILERVRFMSFVASNLDEFFEIRVAGLIQQVESNIVEVGPDGIGPREQLRRIHNIAASLVEDQYGCWRSLLVPEMANQGLVFKTPDRLTKAEVRWLDKYFEEQVYPVLTPLAVDPSHPFPQIGNKTLNLLAWLDDPSTPPLESRMAIIPVPRILPRVVEIDPGSKRRKHSVYIFLSDILKRFAGRLFPGFHMHAVQAFRITRNSDLYFDEEEAENLLKTIEEELFKRRRGNAVRLEIESAIEDAHLERLLEAVGLSREYVFRIDGPINLMRLADVYDTINRPDLKFAPFIPYHPPRLREKEKLFATLSREDILLHHPYDSFAPFVDFLTTAANDPQVFAIKQTLYRTSSGSPVIDGLIQAARNGKQVTALVELKARFDEENNIQWARQLEEEGVHVVYGMVGLKTHCKACLVVRREESGLRRYAHLGTGNYNPKTARLYTDLSFLTSRRDLTDEVADLFNTLTGYGRTPSFGKLLVAPFNLHGRMQELILAEAAQAAAGKPARIVAKVNSLIDRQTIDNLYHASRQGVQIDLIVRGICGLVPGVKGQSENIRVRSILGRYLEHSRVFYFENGGGKPVMLMGSADWMPRNFFRRVETIFPIEDQRLRRKLWRSVLEPSLKDTRGARVLRANGSYAPAPKGRNEPHFSSQEYLMEQAERMRRRAEKSKPISPKA